MPKWSTFSDDAITSDTLKALIEKHSSIASVLSELYAQYKGEVDILDREFEDETLINEKLANDFRGEIVDQVTGYLVGNPVNYTYPDEKVSERLTRFRKLNNVEALDLNTVKMMSTCGIAYRLLYQEDGEQYIINCEPWTIILIWDSTYSEIKFGIRYYNAYNSEAKTIVIAEVYTDTEMIVYNDYVEVERSEHGFGEVPIIPISNNDEELSDFAKVSGLIDAYDTTLSDIQNEVEEFRQAYQVFENCEIDKDTRIAARATGAYNLPKGGKVTYLTKDANPDFIKDHKKTLEENIYRFSKTVNMADEKFSGDTQSGAARKWKLLTLEFRANIKQTTLVAALREQFRILGKVWNSIGMTFDFLDMEFGFTRNIPQELKEAAETALSLKGIVSDKTLLGILPIIEDVDEELNKIAEEQGDGIDLE